MVSVQKISFRANLLNQVEKPANSTVTQPIVEPKKDLPTTPPDVVTLTQPKPDEKKPKPDEKKPKQPAFQGKNLAIASTVISAAALGVGVALAVKNHRLSGQLKSAMENSSQSIKSVAEKFDGQVSQIHSSLQKGLQEAGKKIDSQVSQIHTSLEKGLQDARTKITDLGKWQDGQIRGVREDLSGQITNITNSAKSANMGEILTSPVIVNGKELNLAIVMHGYGKYTEKIERSLRTESTRSIFGIMERNHAPKESIIVRMPTSEFKGFSSAGGMSIVPREVIANLGAIVNNKQKVRLVVDTPMYMGQIEENTYYSLVKRADGLFDYITSKTEKPFVEGLEKIGSMDIPVYLDKGKVMEKVDMYLARNVEQVVDLELLKPWLNKNLQKELKQAEKSGAAFEFDWNALKIKYNPEKGDVKPVARVKYDALFYNNEKFDMAGPVRSDRVKNLYNNETHSAGETERFMYFDKFFYEGLLHSAEVSSEKLGVDVIVGNDWHTGGISAMMKLLTTVRKHFGLNPKVADKIYNTPIVTIMHNAGLAGQTWTSQEKLLNILFGEHSAMITKNAWMPQFANLGAESLNGLFHGSAINPQTMASVYSDVLIPVSKGYGKEMAAHSGFGGDNHQIFRMRARVDEYSDIEHIKYIARQNGLNPDLVPTKNLTYRPITNGCDKVNNTLTDKGAIKLAHDLGMEQGSLRPKLPSESVYSFHQANKEAYLNKVIADVDSARLGNGNPMKIELPEMTDLTGVTKDTMVVSTAGRIVDQKGLDIWAESIEEFLSRHKGEDLPVFYTQGVGEQSYVNKLLDIKRRVADKYGKQAADRIVFAKLFSEPGRYDGCKLMSDFTVMSSWFEPCGLVHKEIASYSGAIPIVNKVGGLTDGLENGVNAIFSEFMPKFGNADEAMRFNRNAFANALDDAFKLYKDKAKFQEVLENSYNANHSWLKPNGAMEEYAQVLVDLKVLKPEVLKHT